MAETDKCIYYAYSHSEKKGYFSLGQVEAKTPEEAWELAASTYGRLLQDVVLSSGDTECEYSFYYTEMKADGKYHSIPLGTFTAKQKSDKNQIASDQFGIKPEDIPNVSYHIIPDPMEQFWLQHESD